MVLRCDSRYAITSCYYSFTVNNLTGKKMKYLLMLTFFLAGSATAGAQDAYTASATYTKVPGMNRGHLHVTVDLAEGYKISSQSDEYPQVPTTFDTGGFGFYTISDWVPSKQPKIVKNVLGEDNEVFTGKVTWTVEIEIMGGLQPSVEVALNGQVCNAEGCLPVEENLVASYAGEKDDVESVPAPVVPDMSVLPEWLQDCWLLIVAGLFIALPMTVTMYYNFRNRVCV